MDKKKVIDYVGTINFLTDSMQTETDVEKRCKYAERIAELQQMEIKNRELAVKEDEIKVAKNSETKRLIGVVITSGLSLLGLAAAAVIRGIMHERAIDKVAQYEDNDILFSGKKSSDIMRD